MSAAPMSLREPFERIAQLLPRLVAPGEFASAAFAGEDSEFVRLTQARLRQAGRLRRIDLRLRLVRDGRQAYHALALSDAWIDDASLRACLSDALQRLRSVIEDSEADPLLDVSFEPLIDVDERFEPLSVAEPMIESVRTHAGDCDLVGFLAAGPIARGLCSSTGAALWFQRANFSFDFSIHVDDARAVKDTLASDRFDATAATATLSRARERAELMRRPLVRVDPGAHRALLSPRACADLIELLGWGGFSARAHRSGQSPLARLRQGDATLSPKLSVSEDFALGLAPRFTGDGLLRPRRIELVSGGRFADWLVSPRTAREFGLQTNAAADAESPECLRVAAGDLGEDAALDALDTGLAIGNLWYLNFSDRSAARVTGMTRFATFWVERGRIVGPAPAMRFDDSLFSILGSRLEALTRTPIRLPALDTYESRATGGIECPGALAGALRFVL
ncbi:MAG TPA: metallopeptidase TldD-related protein [Burkholderiaceae bacterium]|nr:metallopeptidase TldD-related protein [Burkholderiaceae bacterium]